MAVGDSLPVTDWLLVEDWVPDGDSLQVIDWLAENACVRVCEAVCDAVSELDALDDPV